LAGGDGLHDVGRCARSPELVRVVHDQGALVVGGSSRISIADHAIADHAGDTDLEAHEPARDCRLRWHHHRSVELGCIREDRSHLVELIGDLRRRCRRPTHAVQGLVVLDLVALVESERGQVSVLGGEVGHRDRRQRCGHHDRSHDSTRSQPLPGQVTGRNAGAAM
jgi:hypothetical protein